MTRVRDSSRREVGAGPVLRWRRVDRLSLGCESRNAGYFSHLPMTSDVPANGIVDCSAEKILLRTHV